MVYAYCRKNDNHSVRSIENWADNNYIVIDEFVWDDDAKQKDSYDKRKLGIFLFPKLQESDLLIVSEVSCIGRSAMELQRIIDSVFAKIRIRFVCLSINMDVDFAKITAIDSDLLEKFSFAAKLQKTLIHETTKAALFAKRNRGVKLGAANEKYKKNLMSKSQEEIDYIHIKKGISKNKRYLDRPETKAIVKILIKTFNLDEDITKWDWDVITTKGHYKDKILKMMEYYQKSEGLFLKWDFSNISDKLLRNRLCAYLQSIQSSLTKFYSNKKYENMNLEDYVKFASSNGTKASYITPQPQSTKNMRNEKTTNDRHEDVILDTSQLCRIEENTMESQRILSDIFTETDSNEDYTIKVSSPIWEILKVLFTKEVWSYEKVETICKKRKLMIGSVLEQINDYALEKVDDIIIEEDGDNIYVMTEYKDLLK